MIYIIRGILVVGYTAFWAAATCVVGPFDRSGRWISRFPWIWASWIVATCRIEVDHDGLDGLDPNQPFVLMSNHQGVFDIVALAATLPLSYRFVAKKELAWIPVFGWALVIGGHAIIDRANRERAVASLERAAIRVRQGTNVVIYPEGTRSPSGELGELGELKSGGFHLAISAGVPIVPVSVSGSQRITRKRSLHVGSGRIRVHYGEPIPTRGLGTEDLEKLKQRVREAIIVGFDAHLQESNEQTANVTHRSC